MNLSSVGASKIIAQGETEVVAGQVVNVTIPTTKFTDNKAIAFCSVANGIEAKWTDKPSNSPTMINPYSAGCKLTSNTNLQIEAGKSWGGVDLGAAKIFWSIIEF